MATVNAPYPARMEEIDNGSVTSMTRVDDEITLYNRGGDAVETFEVESEGNFSENSIVLNGAFDSDYREVIIKDWYRPRFPNVKNADPVALPASEPLGMSWTGDGRYLAVAHSTTPFITVYKRSQNTLTKLSDPAVLPTAASDAKWSPDGQYLVVTGVTPYLHIYKRSGDVLTKLTNPVTMPPSNGMAIAWSPTGTYFAVAHYGSPYVTIYKRSGDTFTKLTNPSILPEVSSGLPANDVAWSPDGSYLVVTYFGGSRITIYKQSGDVFTKISNPDTIPPGQATGAAFSPDNQYLVVGHQEAPNMTIYKRFGDSFLKLPDPAVTPYSLFSSTSVYVSDWAWSPDGKYLVGAYPGVGTFPFFIVWKRVGDVFTAIPWPTELLTEGGYSCAWSPDGKLMAVSDQATPFIAVYQTANGPLPGPATRLEMVP